MLIFYGKWSGIASEALIGELDFIDDATTLDRVYAIGNSDWSDTQIADSIVIGDVVGVSVGCFVDIPGGNT